LPLLALAGPVTPSRPRQIKGLGWGMSNPVTPRTTVFVTPAAPEDNEFALWLSSKLALAGYRAWVDRRRLRVGDDFWDEIDYERTKLHSMSRSP
jgi:hypothetical protein